MVENSFSCWKDYGMEIKDQSVQSSMHSTNDQISRRQCHSLGLFFVRWGGKFIFHRGNDGEICVPRNTRQKSIRIGQKTETRW